MKKYFLLITLFLSACGINDKAIVLENNGIVDVKKSFYVAKPKTSLLKQNEENPAKILFDNNIINHTPSTLSDNSITFTKGLEEARLANKKYLVTLDVQEWKDASMISCGKLAYDSADVIINVYDVKSGKLLNKQQVKSYGCPAKLTSGLVSVDISNGTPAQRFKDTINQWYTNLANNSQVE